MVMAQNETSRVRAMRYIVRNFVVGDEIYAYQIGKAVDVEPQFVLRIFRSWDERGFIKDEGLRVLPEGLREGPPRRYYSITQEGWNAFTESLRQIKERQKAEKAAQKSA